jgi:hypothetical protein
MFLFLAVWLKKLLFSVFDAIARVLDVVNLTTGILEQFSAHYLHFFQFQTGIRAGAWPQHCITLGLGSDGIPDDTDTRYADNLRSAELSDSNLVQIWGEPDREAFRSFIMATDPLEPTADQRTLAVPCGSRNQCGG